MKIKTSALVLGLIAIWAAVANAQTSRPPARTIALTFDDLPKALGSGNLAGVRRTTAAILQTLNKHHARAIGFVNEVQLHVDGERDERIAILKQWVESGMILGNHTFSHLGLFKTPLPKYEDDVIKGEVITRALMRGREPYQMYFRHPFTNTGPTKEVKEEFERFLESRGYKVAPFTIENSDYVFNALYVDAKKNKDAELMKRIRESYLAHTEAVVRFIEQLSVEMFQREISQILLIHANDLHEDCLDELLTSFERRGYAFVTLDRALEDKAYLTKDDFVGSFGPSWFHRWTVTMGLKMKIREEPDPPKWVMEMYKRRQSG
jgi:peptidoglycan-N-acetylglucosamine deacetylase